MLSERYHPLCPVMPFIAIKFENKFGTPYIWTLLESKSPEWFKPLKSLLSSIGFGASFLCLPLHLYLLPWFKWAAHHQQLILLATPPLCIIPVVLELSFGEIVACLPVASSSTSYPPLGTISESLRWCWTAHLLEIRHCRLLHASPHAVFPLRISLRANTSGCITVSGDALSPVSTVGSSSIFIWLIDFQPEFILCFLLILRLHFWQA